MRDLLSPHGEAQARSLPLLVQSGKLPSPTEIWVSPRIRTQQTMRELSLALQVPLQIRDELQERTEGESMQELKARTQQLSRELLTQEQSNKVVYLCSHYDWLEVALLGFQLESHLLEISWSPGAYLHLKAEGQVWKLINTGALTNAD